MTSGAESRLEPGAEPGSELLLIVADSFLLSGRGLVLNPAIALAPDAARVPDLGLRVRLERPDGSSEVMEALLQWAHFRPGGFRYTCILPQASPEQVPPGSRIWRLDD
ncbi:MAG TPA: hypothetical protein V6D23_07795 [Candidatus Obscuribacterales bacterium]